MSNEDKCICCGRYVPEGRIFCSICENGFKNKEEQSEQYKLLLRMCSESETTSEQITNGGVLLV